MRKVRPASLTRPIFYDEINSSKTNASVKKYFTTRRSLSYLNIQCGGDQSLLHIRNIITLNID